jgi:tRNA(Arg) A34 adenosine deaminase TadA
MVIVGYSIAMMTVIERKDSTDHAVVMALRMMHKQSASDLLKSARNPTLA